MKNPCAGALFMLGMLFALLAVSAHAQSATVQSGQAQPLQMDGHPQQAAPHALGTEQNLLTGGVSIAQGERPLSEFPSAPKHEVPLGDTARYYRTHSYVPMKGEDHGNGHNARVQPCN